MFDRTAYPDPRLLAAQPYVSIEALAALSALLDVEGSNAISCPVCFGSEY
jgi:hypothetical protein